jgi:hypothetical protein
MEEVKELIDQLSKHNIKVVDYDEDEDSIKNRLFAMTGEQPRGHIAPSSWLNSSGELTIYVPKSAKTSPERYKRFLIEEVKHVDQIREAPFKTGILNLYEKIKEGASTIPSKLWSYIPDFVSEEENEKYLDKLYDVGMSGGNLDEIESPYWKENSGIGKLFRSLHYDRYADPESVEGIHINEERYTPVLEKYGVNEVPIKGHKAGGYVMNYGDYGRSYK